MCHRSLCSPVVSSYHSRSMSLSRATIDEFGSRTSEYFRSLNRWVIMPTGGLSQIAGTGACPTSTPHRRNWLISSSNALAARALSNRSVFQFVAVLVVAHVGVVGLPSAGAAHPPYHAPGRTVGRLGLPDTAVGGDPADCPAVTAQGGQLLSHFHDPSHE